MKPQFFPAAALALAGCAVHPPVSPAASPARAGIGQTVAVGGPRVTPLAVVEDSRCPTDVRCAWGGRVVVRVRIDLGARSDERDLEQGKPVHIADGTLELIEVIPQRRADSAILPEDYRLGFRFMGGI